MKDRVCFLLCLLVIAMFFGFAQTEAYSQEKDVCSGSR
jgi:hypothetical protein